MQDVAPSLTALPEPAPSEPAGGLSIAPNPPSPARRPWRRSAVQWATTPVGTAVLLAVLVVMSALFRLEGQRVWFWIDEALSAGIAGHRLSEIPGLLRQDGSPPLYFLILHGWMRVFGNGEVALHALSLLFALGCIPAAFWAGTSLFGRRVGWTAALLVAANPFLTYYGREARMYTLVALLGLFASTTFVHAFAFRRRRYLPAFALALTLLLYTHNWALYFTAGALVALVPCVWRRPEERSGIVRDAAVTFGVAGLAFLPWLPTLAFQVAHTGAPWSRTPSLREAVSQLDAVVGDERVLVILLLVGGVGWAATFRAGWRRRETAAVAVLVLLVLVPLTLSWLSSQVEPNWATRYFAMIVGAVLLVGAIGLARARLQGVAAIVLILLFWTQPLGRITHAKPRIPLAQKSNVKYVARTVTPLMQPGDLVVSTHAEQVPVLHYYLPARLHFATPMGAVADPSMFDWRDVLPRMKAATPEKNFVPLLNALPVGRQVLLVGPVGQLTGERNPAWFVLFHKRTDEWMNVLRADPRFDERVQVGTPNARVAGVSVYAVLFTKTAP